MIATAECTADAMERAFASPTPLGLPAATRAIRIERFGISAPATCGHPFCTIVEHAGQVAA